MPRAVITSWSAARLGWLVGFCALGQPALGQQAVDPQTPSGHDRVGMRVIQKLPEFRFRVGNQLIRPRRVEIYRVSKSRTTADELMISRRRPKGCVRLVESDQGTAVEQSPRFLQRVTSLGRSRTTSWGYYLRANHLASRKKGSRKRRPKTSTQRSVAHPSLQASQDTGCDAVRAAVRCGLRNRKTSTGRSPTIPRPSSSIHRKASCTNFERMAFLIWKHEIRPGD